MTNLRTLKKWWGFTLGNNVPMLCFIWRSSIIFLETIIIVLFADNSRYLDHKHYFMRPTTLLDDIVIPAWRKKLLKRLCFFWELLDFIPFHTSTNLQRTNTTNKSMENILESSGKHGDKSEKLLMIIKFSSSHDVFLSGLLKMLFITSSCREGYNVRSIHVKRTL